MTEVRFYHLTRATLETALPMMLEKTLERGQRAVVRASSEERVEALTSWLWTFRDRSFLPHGSAKDGHAAQQPIWLTEREERPNGAQVLFLTDGATSARLGDYELCAVLFDGNDAAALAAARDEWRRLKEAGHDLTYWQQDADGRWEKKE
jgi:DNA polymerase-3 subunit chi